jgi:GDPmannose 4,6-dehydratase
LHAEVKVSKSALIIGISGQDGSYLAEYLLAKGYNVFGLLRYHSGGQVPANIKGIEDKIKLVYGDVLDPINLATILEHFKPEEIYNLAGPSYGPLSWDMPTCALDVIGLGPVRIMEAIIEKCPKARFYQASSSEMFGLPDHSPQTEKTPLRPTYPYAIGKTMAHHAVGAYRKERGLYAVSGISYNHESPRRPEWFVTRKITRAAARISKGLQDKISLGNITVERDWHYAGDCVRAMWLALQQDSPTDYIISSGEARTIENILEIAFVYVGLDWRDYYEVDPRFVRAGEPHKLVGVNSKIRSLGWGPKVNFRNMIEIMVQADLDKE